MKMHIFRKPWLMLLVFLSLPAMALEPADNSAGPLNWQTTRVPPTFPDVEAVKLAGQYIGMPGTAPLTKAKFVQVTDLTPYNNITKTVYYAWLVTLPGVTVANNRTSATIDVTILVDANDKGLNAAFTTKNPEKWVPRYSSYKERDPSLAMANDGWYVDKPLVNQFNSTVSEVLSAFWRTTGINPQDAGQLFLRPRYVALSLPAKRMGGKLIPLRRPGTYWSVLVSGTKTLDVVAPPSTKATGDTPYMSGLIALFDDNGAQSVRGVYLP